MREINVTHTFRVPNEATDEQVEQAIAAMSAQVDGHAVVGYADEAGWSEVVMNTELVGDTQTLVVVTWSTRNFDFTGLARDEEHAKAILLAAWARHCEQYLPMPDEDMAQVAIDDDEPNYVRIPVGGVLRDGERLL